MLVKSITHGVSSHSFAYQPAQPYLHWLPLLLQGQRLRQHWSRFWPKQATPGALLINQKGCLRLQCLFKCLPPSSLVVSTDVFAATGAADSTTSEGVLTESRANWMAIPASSRGFAASKSSEHPPACFLRLYESQTLARFSVTLPPLLLDILRFRGFCERTAVAILDFRRL